MAQQGDEERTEEPTEKRRREFREEGKVAQSKEVNTALLLSTALLLWFWYAPNFVEGLERFLAGFWDQAGYWNVTPQAVVGWLGKGLIHLGLLLSPILILSIVVGFLSSYIQFGWLFSPKALQPDIKKLDPIQGAAKFVSKRSAMELLKSLAKVAVVGSVAYWTLSDHFEQAIQLIGQPIERIFVFIGWTAAEILLKCCIALLFIAVIDFAYTKWEMEEQMKMTKKELQDEHKETEGDPQLKQRMRSIQRDMARKRMMAEVPQADVVITNPTHYAVALRYDRSSMEAPEVTAKGSNIVAQRIREIAEESGVPLVENPPVARVLHGLELGETVPESMYKAVAEILAYVYSLKGKTA
ncbi:flagellar biosynthesis protein FlhB [Desulfohalobium retbaense]|uniref:Flagellar biosynthetic protein FlhB n=1 Tax=Desulfohalobium retbaense (strain ATCC 49708 / DSM 5692 / JCM 16813 / HR100) TaxID=485915 RepID=C8WYW8_DESRD|nr:flagellar biosynthesis protein FlhB [Desulfohalobium retbaense]ACV67884.1 flagellar biosynthetic protein FlhB [Desulfohalobium retbaense DSM 5692]